MININTKAYILRMIVDLFYLYGLLFYINKNDYTKKKLAIIFIFLPITFISQLFSGLADMIPILSSYLLLKRNGKFNHILLNKLTLCMFINDVSSILSSIIMYFGFSHGGIKGYTYIFIQLILKLFLLSLFIMLYKKLHVNSAIEQYSSELTSVLMIYLFAVSLLVSYAAHYYEAFDQFIIGVAGFVIVQTIFVIIFFIRITLRQKEKYEQQLEKQELINLKNYTDQLEQNQERLSKFKHDYKNILLSLKEASANSENQVFFEQVQELETYSNHYISTSDLNYGHCQNIKNMYLKSLIISKFHEAKKQQVYFKFECYEVIEKIPMPIFDCIRVLGIVLDNAIEATSENEERTISFMIYQDNYQLEFYLENSFQDQDIPLDFLLKKGFTTKENHHGLGLSTIKDINKKNKNMFVQYQKDQYKFSTQIILIWE